MSLNELPPFESRDELHDLLNPVASIAGCAQTLLTWGERIDAAVRDDLARLIFRQAEQLEALIRAHVGEPSNDQRPRDPARAVAADDYGRAS